MTRFFINVQLKVLIVHKKTSPLLENCEMGIILLTKHVHKVSMCELSSHFYHLVADLWLTDGVNITPVT
jgi:hypothetical protein